MSKNAKISIIIALLGFIVVNFFVIPKKQSHHKNSTSVEEKETTGKALIGGKFKLTDMNGKVFSSKKLIGKSSIVYFGFTNCPMVCPTAMNTLTLVINKLGNKADDFNFVFITTDPERDTPERLKEYFANFSDKIIGLTGTKKQLQKAYDGYKVYAEKIANKDGSENYDMNHSSIIYVMDKNGEYFKHFNHESSVDEILNGL